MKLQGTFTAVATPFKSNGEIDFESFSRLLHFNIENGVSGIVLLGTTGEAATLSETEYRKVLTHAVSDVGDKTHLIAGATSNNTEHAKALIALAQDVGIRTILSAGPYYNKPTQTGYIRHFTALADMGSPIILYNVPSRTGGNIDSATTLELAQHDNIVAIKEASGDLDQIGSILTDAPTNFSVLSGDDALTLPIIALGGQGVISVVSNIVPKEMSDLVRLALEGDFTAARSRHYQIRPLIKMCFLESNPIPVKMALSLMGRIEPVYRLPLTPPLPRTIETIQHHLNTAHLTTTLTPGTSM